ncbi:alpha-(1-_3)-arabinofuranosyltransferase domain-containing protein [Aeromicrobium flavum]|uniref:alpha-(1->3)-arabinofuranosyltransferase domain-containing protein n=1 Tax=Aeromicrobium flavum TaxID=416568 RepID=UPI0011BE6B0D|nr:alpha-(1->3)-arabinofuranosyltransferase family protein [Aeromicrobium flavum]
MAILPWVVAPGRIQPDTKLDLTVAPWDYLSRALSAWNSHAGLGELQNQAYGYLFPLGPVMGLSHSVGLPDWAAQRVWWSLLLVVGFVGTYLVGRRIVRLAPDVALVAAALYALAPRVVTVLPEISVEAWPGAVAPWLVLAAWTMVRPSADRRSVLRAAAWTGLLTIALGGVNATASAVVLVLPLVVILTAPRAARRGRALAVWSAGVVVGAAWWIVPLLVLGRYGYPFLDFIETARITTAVTSVPNVLRGADHWIAYILDAESTPVWQSGWVQAQGVVAILSSMVVAGAGVAGLVVLGRDPQRRHATRFLVAAALAGVVMMTIGHGGVLGSPLSDPVRDVLDGIGAALRNVHKADPLVRLPIALGVAVLVAHGLSRAARLPRIATAAVLVAAIVSPTALWSGRGGDANPVTEIPATWTQAADEIDVLAEQDGGSTLVLPAARTAEFTWGKTTDEPLVALAESPVIVRAAAPLGHPGATRLLDRIDTAAASGTAQTGLADVLARMGVTRVVVRHGVLPLVQALPAERVERTLAASPGFTEHRRFGDLSVWTVGSGARGPVRAVDAEAHLVVAGGPESLVDLAEVGLPERAWTTIEPAAPDPDVLTDSLRRRQFNSGRPAQLAQGPTLAADDDAPEPIGARDLPPAGDAATQPVREWVGLRAVEASSTGADPFAAAWAGTRAAPASALDGDVDTAWLTDEATDGRLTLTLPEAAPLGRITVVAAESTPVLDTVTLVARRPDGSTRRQPLDLAAGTGTADLGTERFERLDVVMPAAPREVVRGIAEIRSDQHAWGARIRLPGAVDLTQSAAVLSPREEDAAAPRWALRSVAPARVPVAVTARARAGEALDALLDAPARYTSADRVGDDAPHRPGASFDRDPTTGWLVPADRDVARVEIALPARGPVGRLSSDGTGLAAIRVSVGGRTTSLPPTGGAVDGTGERLTLEFVRGPGEGEWTVPDVELDAVQGPASLTLPCSTVSVGESVVRVGGRVARSALVDGAPLSLAACGDDAARVGAGEVDVRVDLPAPFEVERLDLGTVEVAPGAGRSVASRETAPGRLVASVGAGDDAVLLTTQGANDGWRATTSSGRELEPVVVDGWRQGFRLPAAVDGEVVIDFAPTTAHRWGLAIGPVALLLLLGALVLTRRSRLPWDEPAPPVRSADRRVGWALGGVVGLLCGGLPGVLLAMIAWCVPKRFVVAVAVTTMAVAGVAMALLGVVERTSVGAVLGQAAGLLTLALVCRAPFDDARRRGSGARRTTTTPTPAPR